MVGNEDRTEKSGCCKNKPRGIDFFSVEINVRKFYYEDLFLRNWIAND